MIATRKPRVEMIQHLAYAGEFTQLQLDDETASLLRWEPSDEEALEALRSNNISIKETALQRKVEETYSDHNSRITQYYLEHHLQDLRSWLDEVQDCKEAEA
jgi:hypothetical protein